MATNEAGPQLRRPPPAPSTRNAGTTAPSVRTARRPSNRPPPKSFISAPSGAAPRQPPATNSLPKAAAASASSTPQSAPALTNPTSPTSPTSSTSEVRDELVRRIMPELRALTEQLVKTSIERSIASLLDRQRELEVKVERSRGMSFDTPRDFDAKLEAAIAPLLAKQRALEMMLDAARQAEVHPAPRLGGPPALPTQPTQPTQAAAPRPMIVERPATGPRTDALAAAALSTNDLLDIPAELNGSRRKRVVVFLLLITVIGVLATVASLSVMSNVGAYP